jgi:iron complex transport system substrate-binding protein
MKRFIILLLTILFSLVPLTGCAESSSEDSANDASALEDTITITDVKGREVTIDLPIETYAISTIDVIDYIVPLKGEDAFSMLVGTGDSGGKDAYDEIYYEMFPDLEAQVGIISEHNAPFDLEMILAKNPDVLIVNSAMQAHKYALEIEDQLTEAGIPLVLIDVPGDEIDNSVQDTISLLGQIFQKEDKAEEVNSFIGEQFAIIENLELASRTDKPTVYYEKGGDSQNIGTTSSSVLGWGQIIAYAGGENIADAVLMNESNQSGSNATGGSNSNVLDPEYVLESDPDYIILSGVNTLGLTADDSLSENTEFDIVNRLGWDNLTAVENGDVYEIMHEMNRTIYSFYPCLYLAKTFYPEELADVDPDAILAEFFETYTLLDSDTGLWTLKMNR